jgi:hypothetical protein
MINGKKPLEQQMDAKRVEQTQNVKQLTTSDDAYSPEHRIIRGEMRTPTGAMGKIKFTTDQVNLKEEAKKMQNELGRKYRVSIEKPLEKPLKKIKYNKTKSFQGKTSKKNKKLKTKLIPRTKLKGGGISQRGLGKAFMKGGRAK